MIKHMFCTLLLAAAPVAAGATITNTHEVVSSPGKSSVAFRPLAQNDAAPAKCHPEASKAVACEAQNRAKREALAQRAKAQSEQLANR